MLRECVGLEFAAGGDIDEALEIANNSNYGLSGGVFTQDMRKANRVAAEMEQGNVNINTYFSL